MQQAPSEESGYTGRLNIYTQENDEFISDLKSGKLGDVGDVLFEKLESYRPYEDKFDILGQYESNWDVKLYRFYQKYEELTRILDSVRQDLSVPDLMSKKNRSIGDICFEALEVYRPYDFGFDMIELDANLWGAKLYRFYRTFERLVRDVVELAHD